MGVNFFTKQPSEEYDISVDFADRLVTGRSLLSAAVTAYDLTAAADATSTVLNDGTGAISGTTVAEGVKAGTTGHTYRITFKATLDNADVLEEDLVMNVVDL